MDSTGTGAGVAALGHWTFIAAAVVASYWNNGNCSHGDRVKALAVLADGQMWPTPTCQPLTLLPTDRLFAQLGRQPNYRSNSKFGAKVLGTQAARLEPLQQDFVLETMAAGQSDLSHLGSRSTTASAVKPRT